MNERPQAGAIIAYLRVSTEKQGAFGLGIGAQREAIRNYLSGGDWTVIDEFTEVESGRRPDRPELERALALARVHRCPVIVAKLDRLTRSVAFLSRLIEADVDVRFCDLPQLEGPQGRFLLHSMASVAEFETGLISQRTKAALAAAKARGVKLGGHRPGHRILPKVGIAGRAAQSARATARAIDLQPIIEELRRNGCVSLQTLARGLSERGIPTARGKPVWTAVQVARVLGRALD